MDIDAIALGEDFVKAIETRVAKCDVLIAVIGPKSSEILRRLVQCHRPNESSSKQRASTKHNPCLSELNQDITCLAFYS